MKITMIAALGADGTIGDGAALPWHLPADLSHFKRITMGKPIIMGRRTHESIGRSLPGRLNIVLSRSSGYAAEDCLVAASIEDALSHAGAEEEVMIIGGAAIYEAFMPMAGRMYLSCVDGEATGEVKFPFLSPCEWRVVSRRERKADTRNPRKITFLIVERIGD